MLKKLFIALGVFVALFLAAAVIIPIVYKDKIVALIKDEGNKNLRATLQFSDIDISLIRHFPNLTLSINDLSIVGQEAFAGDTLIATEDLSVAVNLMSLISGSTTEIKSISMEKPLLNFIILKDGKANWDITKPDSSASETSASTPFKVALKNYSINDGRLLYNDESMGFRMRMDHLTHSGKGDFTQDLFTLSTVTEANGTSLWYGGVKYLSAVKTTLKADLDMDMPHMKFTFKENELSLNELVLGMNGWVSMPKDDIDMDLSFNVHKNEFRHFISLVPGVYSESFKDVQANGNLALRAFVKGTFNDTKMPGFGVTLQVTNGKFKYPSLPVGLNNVQVDLLVNNPDGVPDHTAIDLNKFHVELGSEAFDARLRVRTPVSNALVDGMVKGKINFANLSKMVPMQKGSDLRGQLDANLAFKGYVSAIEKKQYDQFQASGSMNLRDFRYVDSAGKAPINIFACDLAFNPQRVELSQFRSAMGQSDFSANGSLDNLLAYVFSKETLRGSLNLTSNKIDLSDFTDEGSSSSSDTAAMTLVEVPAKIDFTLNTQIGTLLYDNLTMSQVRGAVTIRDQVLNMDNLSFQTLGGSLKMSGKYATQEHNKATMALNMDVVNMDIQQTVKTFNTVKKMAPIAEKASGRYSSSFTLNGILDQHMQPVMSTLAGGGKLSTSQVVINSFPPLVKVADVLKMDQFKQVTTGDVNLSFSFENGRVKVMPFNTTLAGIPMDISGSTGFDQSVDYKLGMNIPTAKLPGAATSVISGLMSQANAKGANLSMGENIHVNALVGGTVNAPSVRTDLTGSSAKGTVKDMAKEAFDKQKAEAEAKAKAEADRLKKEAEEKVKSEADRLKKEAEAKAKAEQERLKNEAKKKAKDALNGLFK